MATLAKEWDKQAKLLGDSAADLHLTTGKTIEACRHNAELLVKHVISAFLDAGYMPMALLLGTVAQVVIGTGRECDACLADKREPLVSPVDGSVLGYSSMTAAEHVALYQRAIRQDSWKNGIETVNVRPIGWNLSPADAEALAHVLNEWATLERARALGASGLDAALREATA